ncbi:MAG TPA: alpha/beta hydrolase fold domain-containing protein, partial [Ktedonobacterales bacterium]|nr:alpha/beta hydrolase fold domain-containing protein [Ktedonobacterales bacterium]
DPFPNGLSDGWRVIGALQDGGQPGLFLSGDSAGGGLAASLASLAVENGLPLQGLILLSPWLDLTVSSPSYEANAGTDRLFSRAQAQESAELYLQGHDPRDPRVSPLLGTVRGFPPSLLSVGLGEVLADDALKFHAALQAAGVASDLCAIAGMAHVAVVQDENLPGAAETLAAVCAFLKRRIVAADGMQA